MILGTRAQQYSGISLLAPGQGKGPEGWRCLSKPMQHSPTCSCTVLQEQQSCPGFSHWGSLRGSPAACVSRPHFSKGLQCSTFQTPPPSPCKVISNFSQLIFDSAEVCTALWDSYSRKQPLSAGFLHHPDQSPCSEPSVWRPHKVLTLVNMCIYIVHPSLQLQSRW